MTLCKLANTVKNRMGKQSLRKDVMYLISQIFVSRFVADYLMKKIHL
jgi:hypothetical protein